MLFYKVQVIPTKEKSIPQIKPKKLLCLPKQHQIFGKLAISTFQKSMIKRWKLKKGFIHWKAMK